MMVGVNISDEQLGSIADRTIQEADTNGDNSISFNEFIKASSLLCPHNCFRAELAAAAAEQDALSMFHEQLIAPQCVLLTPAGFTHFHFTSSVGPELPDLNTLK